MSFRFKGVHITSEMVDLRTVDGWMCVCLTNSCECEKFRILKKSTKCIEIVGDLWAKRFYALLSYYYFEGVACR